MLLAPVHPPIWPVYRIYDRAKHNIGCAACCWKFEIRVTQRYSRWLDAKLDACESYMPHKQAKTLYYTSKSFFKLNWASFWSTWNARIGPGSESVQFLLKINQNVCTNPCMGDACWCRAWWRYRLIFTTGRHSYFRGLSVDIWDSWTKNPSSKMSSESAFNAFKW